MRRPMSLMIVPVCPSKQLTDYMGSVLFREQPPGIARDRYPAEDRSTLSIW
jgi:hypothetical protein